MSLTSVDLPEPDTPVTHVKVPSGIVTDWPLRLCSRGSWLVSACPVPLRRVAGPRVARAAPRGWAGSRGSLAAISSGGALGTPWAPGPPAAGPVGDPDFAGPHRSLVGPPDP